MEAEEAAARLFLETPGPLKEDGRAGGRGDHLASRRGARFECIQARFQPRLGSRQLFPSQSLVLGALQHLGDAAPALPLSGQTPFQEKPLHAQRADAQDQEDRDRRHRGPKPGRGLRDQFARRRGEQTPGPAQPGAFLQSGAVQTVAEGLRHRLVGARPGGVEAEADHGAVAAHLQDIAGGQHQALDQLAVDPDLAARLHYKLVGLSTAAQQGVPLRRRRVGR